MVMVFTASHAGVFRGARISSLCARGHCFYGTCELLTSINHYKNSLWHSRLRVVPHFPSGIVERAKRERAWKSPHARKGDTRLTRSLVTYKLIIIATHPKVRRHQPMLRCLETIKRKCLLKQPNLVTSYNGAYLFSVICMPMMINYLHILGFII